ncbi:MAG TPA: ATP-dependent 6-phosphofructokinase, partial [Oligoflexia bacterium]|nr:ATP-dependent 6-phosphofructokinase [Oligoflexia bacterium]
YGYAGLAPDAVNPPLELAAERVDDIQELPGTILGSSRGPVPAEAMLETLRNYGVKILFTVGGDGTLRGASALAAEIKRQKLSISVIGVPKTIDNDLNWLMRSFGFSTAVDAATRVLDAAHCEAKCAWNGIGLVKLMGRHSGFIAAHATVASGIVNFCLVPEVPFSLEGKNGFLNVLEQRMQRKHHAVVVAAEGAGQDLIQTGGPVERDASGNVRFKDIGAFLKAEIEGHFARRSIPVNVRYIDPSYTIRGLPASAVDAEFCVSLGQHAVHAGMSGRTDMVVGAWNQHYTHVPIKAVVESRKQIDTQSPIWQTVLNTTHQPACMIG